MDTSYTVKDCVIVDIPTFTDNRGTISVMDKELPFEVKRVFWLHHINEGQERGAHALLEGAEVIIAIHGSFMVDMDDGKKKVSVSLCNPSKGLLIRPGIWFKTHGYTKGGVSLILADEEYRRDRYVYDYDVFLSLRMTK